MSKKQHVATGISFFEKYLTLWVALCMVAGILIGKFIPAIPTFLGKLEYANVSIPVAILIWLMIYPMMMKVDFKSVKGVGKNPKGLLLTWITNWLIKPFTMAAMFPQPKFQEMARAYAEVFAGLHQRPEEVLSTTFDLGHDELVLVSDIEVYSTCEHHLVPFHGVAHVGYIPSRDGRITGLSKIARLVDVYAKRPQVQERLTTQVADAMVRVLEPRGVIVVIECEHLCMSMRGVRKPGARTVTSAVRGVLRETATRAEVMSLILKS